MASDIATSSNRSLRRKLGRGLGSLISTPVQVETPANTTPSVDIKPSGPNQAPSAPEVVDIPTQPGDSSIRMLAIGSIRPNPKQPRQHFDEAALQTLAASIATSGLMQPIVVRPEPKTAAGGGAAFQIIAGERRWRAAQIAGLKHIPAVARDVDERTAAELSLVENLQREDLNPVERADAFRRLISDFGLTHQEVAQQVGLDRTSVTNHLRLLELEQPAIEAIRQGELTMGHAKALLSITNIGQRANLAAKAVREQWSVRELERRAKAGQEHLSPPLTPPQREPRAGSANSADLARRLGEHLGTKVAIKSGRNKGSGRLLIDFYSLDQFEGLLRQMQFELE